MARKRERIETKEQAIEYLSKVFVEWCVFCHSHKKMAKSIEILLKEVKKK